jgi:poly(3-hydroxybutyrate) depolymerase
MSQRTACSAADTFGSVTSYGGGTPTLAGFADGCSPSRPISVGLFAGQFDFTYAGLAQNTSEWRAVDNCAATPAHTTDQYGSTDTYSCAGGSKVLSRVVNATSHNWPFGAQGEDQRTRMWAFFTANPKP